MIINKVVLSPEIMVKYQKILSNPLTHKCLLKSYSLKLCDFFAVLCVTIRTYHYSNFPKFHYTNLYGMRDEIV